MKEKELCQDYQIEKSFKVFDAAFDNLKYSVDADKTFFKHAFGIGYNNANDGDTYQPIDKLEASIKKAFEKFDKDFDSIARKYIEPMMHSIAYMSWREGYIAGMQQHCKDKEQK